MCPRVVEGEVGEKEDKTLKELGLGLYCSEKPWGTFLKGPLDAGWNCTVGATPGDRTSEKDPAKSDLGGDRCAVVTHSLVGLALEREKKDLL